MDWKNWSEMAVRAWIGREWSLTGGSMWSALSWHGSRSLMNRFRTGQGQSCLWVYFVWSDPTQPISWLNQPNPTHYKPENLDPCWPNPIQLTNLTAWCNQILSNRALNALTQSFQNFSTFATQPTKNWKISTHVHELAAWSISLLMTYCGNLSYRFFYM